jgi:hypothetical protein
LLLSSSHERLAGQGRESRPIDPAIIAHDNHSIDKIAQRNSGECSLKEALLSRWFVLAWADKAPPPLREAAMHLGIRAAHLKTAIRGTHWGSTRMGCDWTLI